MINLNLPEQIKAEFSVLTPMFIGDAQKQAEHVYPQSVKGALRFWWRALLWRECREQAGDDIAALHLLHQWENALFGCLPDQAEKDQGSAFALRVMSKEVVPNQRETVWPKDGNAPSGYLGMGIWESGKESNYQPHREGIPKLGQPYSFTISLTLNSNISEAQKEQLHRTLQCFGLFGGLGSRARRGFGSVQLHTLNGHAQHFHSKDAYDDAANTILQHANGAPLAPYSAFSKDSTFISISGFDSAEEAHKELGVKYKHYRGQPSELRGIKKIAFGLPLTGVDEKVRRASPLFFHIFHLDHDDYGYSVLHLPASIFHAKHNDADFRLTAGFIKQLREI